MYLLDTSKGKCMCILGMRLTDLYPYCSMRRGSYHEAVVEVPWLCHGCPQTWDRVPSRGLDRGIKNGPRMMR